MAALVLIKILCILIVSLLLITVREETIVIGVCYDMERYTFSDPSIYFLEATLMNSLIHRCSIHHASTSSFDDESSKRSSLGDLLGL
jgi:hypothetical protein